MLKLTNSFYRYLAFTCEKVSKAHVRRFSQLNCKRKTCGTGCTDVPLLAQFHLSLQLRQHSHGKKRLKIKIPPLNANECKRHKPMSDPLQPTFTHASYGGQFEVTEHDPLEEWRRQTGEAASSGEGRTPRPIPQDFRVWEPVGTGFDPRQGSGFKFKVLSYNLLAQYLLECHPYLYTDCSSHDLKWKVRASRLYDEITSLAPDILCFQEVQATHLQSFYSKFEEIGYYGIFKQKTGHRQDGCAIYFKKSLFDLKEHISVEFFQPELPILNRDNIGIMVKLTPRGLPGCPMVVATTHLLYNPKRTDVRLAQMQVFLAEIDRFAYYDNGRESGHVPIILTGDFNSTPDSAVIKLLDRGNVSASPFRDSSDWRRIGVTDNCQHLSVILNRQEGRQTDYTNIKIFNSEYCVDGHIACGQAAASTDQFSGMFNSGIIGHSLNLASVYQTYRDGDYTATTFQDYWVTVDYIYFSYCNTLRLVERLRLPSTKECDVLGRLPNHVYGSDHLALAALFELNIFKSTL
ncbi:protein angel isoform X3 [Trichoplusia ni]|uniref:Protein angel isoform X3 n=1 Tax=Trichoplusia ni TaxID=7111 RepID=A0A7E5WNV9_TRINI|nr:protein angel isoform X3 [Trichoplusia ni]